MVKLTLIGAAGQIGTPLSLLCKASDLFDELALYDLVHVPGIATDLMHIDTKTSVTGHLPDNSGLTNALRGADIVVVTAGIARKPGMTRDDLFQTNARIIRDIFSEIATTCPDAFCCIVTNPVNSTVPVAAQTLKAAGVFQPTRLFGVTTLDVVRASTFAAQALGPGTDPRVFRVPVIGGHSGATILPLYSQAEPPVNLDEATLAGVINRVQFGGDEIVTSKKGAGSATTCMAYAGFRFIKAVVSALNGEEVTEEAFVYLPGIEGGEEVAAELGVDYFAVRVVLEKTGAVGVLPVGELAEGEKRLLEVATEELNVNIATGLSFV
ncbi:malate dehydrogenase [Aspergillus sclerotiicarbonarius CBS 121057]|uniref:malate dehydrogenase n=1 Tax=Aspergillus sclerotiicarbonarius (strain CBS 121057 / IBT 28362) TaxID=1448318 RepID=A0A319EAT6_ASPSB|nr:malate dehydrogenase [Aspergillus sclerotiicarbonarius CBS 121057]